MSLYGPPEAYEGRLADLRGPKWPSRFLPTHVIESVYEDYDFRRSRAVWRIVAYSLKDCTKCVVVWNTTWLPRRCV